MVRNDEAMSPEEFERLLRQDITTDIRPLIDREIIKKGEPIGRLLAGLGITRTEFSEVLRGNKLKSNILSISMTDAISALAWKDKPLPQRLAYNASYVVNKWANDVTGGQFGVYTPDDNVSYYSEEALAKRRKAAAEIEKLSGWQRFWRENKVVLLFFLLVIGLIASMLLLIKLLIELYI